MSEINITNDRKIIISKAKSHNSTNWKNESLMLSVFINRLSNPYYTNETAEQFKNMDKENKDKIKNCIGGFVGGALKGDGKRNNDNIKNRCLITLDIDHCSTSIEEQLKDIEYSYAIYSTHSHREDYQRFRLIIPLDRDVTPIEYEAIARMSAYKIDKSMDMFDDTTYESVRLMYWPSTPKGGTYYFKYHDGEFLKADDVLGEYIFGWEDRSSWPVSSRKSKKIISDVKKQQDPLSKKGIIGAFCRTYTIQEAIDEYLSDIYRLSDDGSRATYINGSTSNGIVIYDDKFSYSHHSTDPAGDILVNSFDLVRILKFSQSDEGVRPNTKSENLPSFIEMKKLAASDKKVVETIGKERMEKAQEDFDMVPDEEVNTEWLKELTYTEQGKIASTIKNFRLIIENEPLLKGKYYLDIFANKTSVIGKLPWDSEINQSKERTWLDSDDSGLEEFIETYYGISSSKKLDKGLINAFEHNARHPIKEYISSWKWDGELRVETLFVDYLGAEDTPYNRMVAKKTLVAAIARIFEPGCKYEEIPILYGIQGQGKSTLVKKLGGKWFSDSLTIDDIRAGKKQIMEQTNGFWILELAEVISLGSKNSEILKAFSSSTEDVARMAFGKRNSIKPRQFIIIATTNKQEVLSDSSGNRRFLPITTGVNKPCKDIFDSRNNQLIKFSDERDQIWAEAYSYYLDGYKYYLDGEEKELAREQQELFTFSSDEYDDFLEYINKPILKVNEGKKDWYSLSLSERIKFLTGDSDFAEDAETEPRTKICIKAIYDEFISPKYGIQCKPLDHELELSIKNKLTKAGWHKYSQSGGRMKFGIYGKKTAFVKK